MARHGYPGIRMRLRPSLQFRRAQRSSQPSEGPGCPHHGKNATKTRGGPPFVANLSDLTRGYDDSQSPANFHTVAGGHAPAVNAQLQRRAVWLVESQHVAWRQLHDAAHRFAFVRHDGAHAELHPRQLARVTHALAAAAGRRRRGGLRFENRCRLIQRPNQERASRSADRLHKRHPHKYRRRVAVSARKRFANLADVACGTISHAEVTWQ